MNDIPPVTIATQLKVAARPVGEAVAEAEGWRMTATDYS